MTDFEKQIAVLDQLFSCVDKLKTRDEYTIVQRINVAGIKFWYEGGNPLEIPLDVTCTEEQTDESQEIPVDVTCIEEQTDKSQEIRRVVVYTEEQTDKSHSCQCQELASKFHTILTELPQLGIVRPTDWLCFANEVANRKFDHARIVDIASQITTMKDELTIKAGQDEIPSGPPDPNTPDEQHPTDAEIASQIVVKKLDIGQKQTAAGPKGKRPGKRSTSKGDAEAKLISAMTTHHKYDAGSCLNTKPIGNNELSSLAEVAKSTASLFIKKQFGGLENYHRICNNPSRLVNAMKLLNGEIMPSLLLQHDPSEKSRIGEE